MPLGRPTSLAAHAFIFAAVASRFAEWMKLDMPAVVLKALPVLILTWGVWAHGRRDRNRMLIVVGLLLSALGDVLLAWPADLFVPGLIAFLLAHITYIAAFVRQERRPAAPWLVPFVAVGGGVFAYLFGGLGDLLIPVAAYVVVITAMAWRAGALVGRVSGGSAAVLGASLFLLSDSLLAINKFGHPFTMASEAIMWSYWGAQFWIARSAMPLRTVKP